MRTHRLILASMLAATPLSLASEPVSTPPTTAPATQPARYRPAFSNLETPISRVDMAAAYLRFERIWREFRPTGARLKDFNWHFDGITYLMMRNDLTGAVRLLNDLTDTLLPNPRVSDDAKLLRSLRLRVSPTINVLPARRAVRASVTPLYPTAMDAPRTATLTVWYTATGDDQPRVALERIVPIDPADPWMAIDLPALDLQPGRYTAQLVSSDDARSAPTTFYVVPESLSAISRANERLVAALDSAGPLRQAIFAFRARNRLLSDNAVFEGDTTQFLSDPLALRKELDDELKQLQAGRDPYVGRIGDYWRAFLAGATSVPARVFAPAAARDGRALPLVIALHGMGGDENMFMEGYGGGVLKELAQRAGFILVTPSTYSVAPNPASFESIVDTMASLYNIDRSRVYVVGHSMGAMVAGGWAVRYSDRLAAACLIAGGQVVGAASAPVLMVAGEFDSLFSLERMRGYANRAIAAGLPIEFRTMVGYGHVLLVGDVMPEAVRWMLEKTTHPTTQPAE
jgi:predicted esterase